MTMETMAAPVATACSMTISDTNSLKNFSDRMLCDDSGFFETMTQTDAESLDESSLMLSPSHNSTPAHRRGENVIDLRHVLRLRPLYFEVPGLASTSALQERTQVLAQVDSLFDTRHRGVVLTGQAG